MIDNNDIKLYKGDCIDVMQQLIEEGVKVDLTVTSPPYDNLRTYGNSLKWNFDIFKQVADKLYQITADGGVVVWVVGDATINGNETGTSFRQALYFKEVGFNLHDTMIYEKNGCGACGSNKSYIQNFEYMFVFSKGIPKSINLIYDRQNIIKPSVQYSNSHRDVRVVDSQKGREVRLIKTEAYGRRFNIWRYTASRGDEFSRKHPAPYPELLANDHIISWSNEGDIILDCFMGSGTTGKMAVLNNRKFIGIEKVDEYFDISKRRIEKAVQDKSMMLF